MRLDTQEAGNIRSDETLQAWERQLEGAKRGLLLSSQIVHSGCICEVGLQSRHLKLSPSVMYSTVLFAISPRGGGLQRLHRRTESR